MKNRLLRRVFSFALAFVLLLGLTPAQPKAETFDKENSQALS